VGCKDTFNRCSGTVVKCQLSAKVGFQQPFHSIFKDSTSPLLFFGAFGRYIAFEML
jgi:hypothetical protein